MRSIGLETRWHAMLSEMFIELTWCWQGLYSETKKVEQAFHICQRYWNNAKESFLQNAPAGDAEEICFFRNVKPTFASELGFYTLLYNSLLYTADDQLRQKVFWQQEKRRLPAFIERNAEFVSYYETNGHYLDEFYFLRRNTRQFPPPVRMTYDLENELYTAKDHLVTAFLTEKRYLNYVNTRCQ